MPGIVKLGETLTGFKIFGHILFFLLAVLHIVAIATVYRNARIFTVITSVEMMQDRELIEKVKFCVGVGVGVGFCRCLCLCLCMCVT